MSQAKFLERAIFPYMVTLQAIPILAIVPLISFWFGTGQTSRVVVCVIISLFPIIVNTLFGLQSAEKVCMTSSLSIMQIDSRVLES